MRKVPDSVLIRRRQLLRANLIGRAEASGSSLAQSYGLDINEVQKELKYAGVIDND